MKQSRGDRMFGMSSIQYVQTIRDASSFKIHTSLIQDNECIRLNYGHKVVAHYGIKDDSLHTSVAHYYSAQGEI